jgi:O-antigen/teichoic acid export membrane protein
MSGASRTAVAVTGAATTILIARLLGPAGAGAFAIAQTLIIVLTIAVTLGVEHGIVYYVSSGRWSARLAFRDSQRLALLSGIAGAGAGLLARALVPQAFHGLSPAVTLVAVAALPFALSWFYASYVALATDHYEGFVLPAAVQSALALLFVGTLAAIDGVPGAVLGFTIAHVITAVATLAGSRRSLRRTTAPPQSPSTGELRRAVSFGIKGYAANALQLVNYRLDLFILNATAVAAAVGHYSVAVSVTSVMWLLPQALSDVLFPRVAALSARSDADHAEMRAFAEAKTLRHSVLVTVVVAIAVALGLVFLVVPIYGAAFHQSTVLGLILLPGVALLAICGPLLATVVGRGHPGLSLVAAIAVTPPTVVMYLVLIPALHASGAALASSVSYAAMFVLAVVFYRRVTGANPLRLMRPTKSELADYRGLARVILSRLTPHSAEP